MMQILWKAGWQFLKKLSLQLPYDPVITLKVKPKKIEKICPHKILHMNIHSNITG